MNHLVIEYPLFFFKRRANGASPASWDELSETQFIGISRLVHGGELDFNFLALLTSFSRRLIRALSPYQLAELSDQFDFIGKGSKGHNSFFSTRLKGTNLVAPKPRLAGMTFGQFIFADAYYNQWLAGKEEETLNKFIASLYLMPGERFKEEGIATRKRVVGKVPMTIRLSIAYNYSLIIAWLQQVYPLIFHSPAIRQEVDGNSPESHPKDSGWLKVFDLIVGDDLINRDRYARLPIHTVLNYLTTKYKENARGH